MLYVYFEKRDEQAVLDIKFDEINFLLLIKFDTYNNNNNNNNNSVVLQ